MFDTMEISSMIINLDSDSQTFLFVFAFGMTLVEHCHLFLLVLLKQYELKGAYTCLIHHEYCWLFCIVGDMSKTSSCSMTYRINKMRFASSPTYK